MKISSLNQNNINIYNNKKSKSNNINFDSENKKSANYQTMLNTSQIYNIPFKSVYIDEKVDLGDVIESKNPLKLKKKDALLLNEIASLYPNQDCFVTKGFGNFPALMYREKPIDIQLYSENDYGERSCKIEPDKKNFESEALILYPYTEDEDVVGEYDEITLWPTLNMFLGAPSLSTTSPSLNFTMWAGFELHKKLFEKKFQIERILGNNDKVDLGEKSIQRRAHYEILDFESAVIRYLLESAYVSIKKLKETNNSPPTNFNDIEHVLGLRRKIDLSTSVAKQQKLKETNDPLRENFKEIRDVDLCDALIKNYPNEELNRKQIELILDNW